MLNRFKRGTIAENDSIELKCRKMVILGGKIAPYPRLKKQNRKKSAKTNFFKLKPIWGSFYAIYSPHINFEHIWTPGSIVAEKVTDNFFTDLVYILNEKLPSVAVIY